MKNEFLTKLACKGDAIKTKAGIILTIQISFKNINNNRYGFQN
jgi:hypothetical protein